MTAEQNISSSWDYIFRCTLKDIENVELSLFREHVKRLKSNGYLDLLRGGFIDTLQDSFITNISNNFWFKMQNETLCESLNFLNHHIQSYCRVIRELENVLNCNEFVESEGVQHTGNAYTGSIPDDVNDDDICRTFLTRIHSKLFLQEKNNMNNVTLFYEQCKMSLDRMLDNNCIEQETNDIDQDTPHAVGTNSVHGDDDDDDDDDGDVSMDQVVGERQGGCTIQQLTQLIHQCGILESFAPCFVDTLKIIISKRVKLICKDQFEQQFLDSLALWLQQDMIPYLSELFNRSAKLEHLNVKYSKDIQNHLYEEFVKLSIPAVMDLKRALIKTGLHHRVIEHLQKAFSKRLLQAGARTDDIITIYFRSIKVLEIIDPTGVSFEKATSHVKKYIRKRPDTMKSIVRATTEEEGGHELFEELSNTLNVESDDESDDENWTPRPLFPDPRSTKAKGRDIIKIIVENFGGKEAFISEYKTQLSERLLDLKGYDTNSSTRILELLKMRFGEKWLHTCEIMIKDITDSKFINNHIQSKLKEKGKFIKSYQSASSLVSVDDHFVVEPVIISHAYWSTAKQQDEDSLVNCKLHPVIEELMDHYQTEYKIFKEPRYLIWQRHQGNVDLEVEIGNEIVNVTATPIHCSILLYLCDEASCSLDSIGKKMNLPMQAIQKRIGFWVNRGFVKKVKEGEFCIVSEKDLIDSNAEDMIDEDEGEESLQNQETDSISQYEPYVISMLTNMGSMDLAKIHSMLKVVVPDYDKSITDLGALLNQLVQEEKIDFNAGFYSRMG